MVTLPLPSDLVPAAAVAGMDPLQELLFRQHGVEVPVFGWPSSERRWLRFTAQAYNQLGQYRRLAGLLLDARRH
jgi:hypothetical protein